MKTGKKRGREERDGNRKKKREGGRQAVLVPRTKCAEVNRSKEEAKHRKL